MAGAQDQIKRLEAEKTSLAGQIAELQTRLQKAEEVPPGVSVHELQDRIAQLEAALADSQTAVQAMMVDKPMISQVMDKWKSAQQALGGGAELARLQARVTSWSRTLPRRGPGRRSAAGADRRPDVRAQSRPRAGGSGLAPTAGAEPCPASCGPG